VLGGKQELHDPQGLVAGIVEFFGGCFVALGLFAAVAAFLACGEMAVAYFMVHAPRGFWPILNGGERAVLFCFFFLYVATRGSGKFSIDALLRRKRTG
jgi:putative oxidoreductase